MSPIRKTQVRDREEKEEVREEVMEEKEEVHNGDHEVGEHVNCVILTIDEYEALNIVTNYTRTCTRCSHEGQLSRLDFVRHHVCGERINDLMGFCGDCVDEIGYI